MAAARPASVIESLPSRALIARRASFAIACGALVALACPPTAVSCLGWIALMPLLLAVDGTTIAAAGSLGWCAGTVAGLGVCGYWMWRAAIDYFGLGPTAAAAFIFAVVEVFVAPYFALFAAAAAIILRSGRWRIIAIPAAFVSTEYARALLGGNAWELLGHSQRSLILLQSASVTGVYGLSFLLALIATLFAEGVRRRRVHWQIASRPVDALVLVGIGLTALAVVLGFGLWRLRHPPAATATLRAALVQGNVANGERGRADRAPEIIDRYLALTTSVQPLPSLVVWPENAIPIFPDDNAELIEPIRTLALQSKTAILAGAPRADQRAGVAAVYNAAYLFTAAGQASVYEKRRLLPFVERLLLRTRDGPYVVGTTSKPIRSGSARIGVLICYEVIDASLAAGPLASGANVLLNLSNDSWFDAGAGPAQHYDLARFRAVESGVSLLRATNSGVTGAFDPVGGELIRLPRGVPAAAAVEVPIVERPSFYARHGDWFAVLCVAITVAALVSRRIGRAAMRRARR